MRVRRVILIGPLPPPYGGVAIFMNGLREFLKGRGVKVWTYGGAQIENDDVSYFSHRSLGIIRLLIKQGFNARIVDSSHYLIEHPNPLLIPLWVILRLILRFEWIKVVHDGSLPARYQEFNLLQWVLFRMSAGAVDLFVCVSEEIREWLENVIGVRSEMFTASALLPIPPTEMDGEMPVEISALISRHQRIICSTGFFIESYGFAEVADAVERVRLESGEDLGLLLLDGGAMSDEGYRAKVLENRDWVMVLERVPHPAVLQILKRAAVFVRGFRYEGYGLSRIEAILCGTPVIATNAGETRGMATFEFGDQERLVELIRNRIENPDIEETRVWADRYRAEAEENLRRWSKLILPEGANG